MDPMSSIRLALIVATLACVVLGAGPVRAEATPAASKSPAVKKPAAAKAKKPAAPAAEPVSGPQVREFQAFCDTWMQKLRDRETYNTSHIDWEQKDGRVVGEHIAYGTACTCSAHEEPGKVPIGKITYREMRYRQEGATSTAAQGTPGTMVEQSDVTEIFRFDKGRWQY
jgi:hypothetical protein